VQNVLLFSLTAMANPTLVAATTVMLVLDHPKRLMLGYLLGALMTSITIGCVIVFALSSSSAVSTAKRTINPIADLAVGAILLIVAYALHGERRERLAERRRERKERKQAGGAVKAPPRWKTALENGSARTTFVVGAVLTLPGASYLAALHSLTELHYSTAGTVVVVVMINVIMLALLEVPLIAFTVAPEWTPAAIERVKAWFSRRGAQVAITGVALLGSLLVLRGVITLLAT
jgi:hypothetical protein